MHHLLFIYFTSYCTDLAGIEGNLTLTDEIGNADILLYLCKRSVFVFLHKLYYPDIRLVNKCIPSGFTADQ